MTPEKEHVLIHLLAEEDALAEAHPPHGVTRAEFRVYAEELQHGPRFNVAAWFDARTAAEQKQFLRAIESLENEGMLQRWGRGHKFTNIKLTPHGRQVAGELVERQRRRRGG